MTLVGSRTPSTGTRAPTSVLDRLAAGTTTAAVTFAGQGVDAFPELADLVADRPELGPGLVAASAVLEQVAAADEGGRFRHGFDVAAWAADPDGAPPAAYLRSSAVSYPLILLTQALRWRALCDEGLDASLLAAVTGHSQGLLAAMMVAETPVGLVDDERLARYLRLALGIGTHMGMAAGAMAAVVGPRRARVAAVLAEVDPAGQAVIALQNTPTRVVVSGPAAILDRLHARLDDVARAETVDRQRGRRGGTPLRFGWQPLPVDAPFHSPALSPDLARFTDWLASWAEWPAAGVDLGLPLISPVDGSDLRRCSPAALMATVARSQFVDPVDWVEASRGLAADWILDLGPGTDVARLTAENVRGGGSRVLPLASPEGRRLLGTPGAASAEPDVRYADFVPGVVELPDGRRHVDNRYSRLTGQPPVILPGMTPTTADAPIVAAAANAGYTAELAGGGQRTERVFQARMAELAELLDPGATVVFNALYLDRNLWDLHFGRHQLVLKARRAGVPLAGLTVSAGVPEVAEAVELLDRLAAEGMVHNAFKPGTVEQVAQVLAVADAAPRHTVFVHLEGGKGGGHHSWEDLDELLLDTYHDLRLRRNVVLCVGGGIATPDRAADLLTGAWSVPYCEPPMPVDGVLLGTVAMACAEAAASPQVKAALVGAAGVPGWVAWKGVGGGVTSGRSNLNADIHLLDNTAARTGILLEEVAGDSEAAAARHDELVGLLAGTSKPWFGDVESMTYLAVLARWVELCATGRHGRYDDGAWGDPGWRTKALELFRRYASRLAAVEDGPVAGVPVAVAGDLDDPVAAQARFAAAFPAAASTLLHPADAQHFLEVCDRPSKPVPFVPVIDGEVRRWFMADALWQAQDDRYPVDSVIVIPGPESVAGITRADEPVAELLARFEAATIRRLSAGAMPAVLPALPARRDRLADTGLAPAWLATVVRGRGGPVARLCTRASVVDAGRSVPNPLWRLTRPGDEITAEVDEAGDLIRLEVRPPGSGEVVVAEADGDEGVRLTMSTPGLRRPTDDLVLRVESGVVVDGPGRRAAFYRKVLLGEVAPACADPSAPVETAWVCDSARVASYRAVTGAAHVGVPLDLAFSLVWPGLAALLAGGGLAASFGGLVHHEHRVTAGGAWPPRPGERGQVTTCLERAVAVEGGCRIECRAELRSARGPLATVVAGLLVRAPTGAGPRGQGRRTMPVTLDLTDQAEVDLVAEQPWIRLRPGVVLSPGDRLTVGVVLSPGDRLTVDAASVDRDDVVVAEVADDFRPGVVLSPGDRLTVDAATIERRGEVVGEVVDDTRLDALLAVLEHRPDERRPRPRRPLTQAADLAPPSMRSFALVGGDHNPLHRSVLAARLSGLDAPVVHGMWTAARAGAFVVDEVCAGIPSRLLDWSVRFVAPVALGAAIDLEATAVAVEAGAERVEVVVSAGGTLVATAEALVGPPPTALLFPGQGVQSVGMGSAGRSRSAAARAVWTAADALTRSRLGFSLREVVDDNPLAVRLADGSTVRHPAGVLFRTEMAQAALVALAAAQVAELEDDGELGRHCRFVACGHSAGEYSALLALGVLPLEVALELVWRRGLAQQACIARDGSGGSPYRLAVVDPQAAGVDLDELIDLVGRVARSTGELLEVVNHNVAGRQYAVAGTEVAIAALGRRMKVQVVPGIDIPFHSSAMAPAVPAFRAHLEALVPEVDPGRLVGRWVSNLVGRPFSLDPAFVADVARLTGVDELLAGTGNGTGTDPRRLLIELLAHQVANPVRWVETQAALRGLARLVEVGPGEHPVLANLARTTFAGHARSPVVTHVELDRYDAAKGEAPEPTNAPSPTPAPTPAPMTAVPRAAGRPVGDRTGDVRQPTDSPTPAPVAAVPRAAWRPVGDRPVEEIEVDAGSAFRMVLAVQARIRPDQIRGDETMDELFGGASSRRNQVLVDLGRELGLSGSEGFQDLPVDHLVGELRARVTRYRFPGPYLRDTMAAGVTRALGGSGVSRADALAHLGQRWALGPGLAEQVLAGLVLDTRPGPSARGGALGRLAGDPPATVGEGRGLVDRAVDLVAADLGLALSPPDDPSSAAPVDAAAVADLAGRLEGALVATARHLAAALDRPFATEGDPLPRPDPDLIRLAALDAELGPGRSEEVRPRFDHRRHVRFASAWAAARWDLVACYHDALAGHLDLAAVKAEVDRLAAFGDDPALADIARWLVERASTAGRPDVATALAAVTPARRTPLPVPATRPTVEITATGEIVPRETPHPSRVGVSVPLRGSLPRNCPVDGEPGTAAGCPVPDLRQHVALVTGASPGSIAAEVVRHLLRGGATVVVATSTDTPGRRRWYRDLYRRAAGPGAELHVVPANLAAFADIDALVGWLERPEVAQRGRPDLRLDMLVPTIVVPFAAVATVGDLTGAGAAAETAVRIQLLGLERLVAGVAGLAARQGGPEPVTVVLPLSPNQGAFGGDGVYGETKAALEVLIRRRRSEHDGWGRHVRLVAARIGWVRGTGLMGWNDAVASLVEERLRVRTFSAAEMGSLLAAAAVAGTGEVDLMGGLDEIDDLRAAVLPLAQELTARAAVARRTHGLRTALAARVAATSPDPTDDTIEALPSSPTDTSPPAPDTNASPHTVDIDPSQMVVIVGTGELGPCGSARTRFELEADHDLSPDGVAELAWLTGLVTYRRDGYRGRWVDTATGDDVAEEDLARRYRPDVMARLGLRPLEADGVVDPDGLSVLATVHLDRDLTFEVASADEARSFVDLDPTHTDARRDPQTGAWRVTRAAGAPIRVPRRVRHTRRVAGQFPTGLDLARYGIPGDLLTGADRMALVNLACTVEAFWDAGLEPEDLLTHVHPALVANTQGAGLGGMGSLRRLLMDWLLDDERQSDRLQESLGNVIAAHAVQGLIGSYGPMVHPVAACATAAISLEEAVDKIVAGKALAVVAGGFDDLTPEGIVGFGDMQATASSDELDAMGIAPDESSRANDVRRRGFVEAQGGATLLVVRGDVALEMGLPVRAVVAYAASFGDGINASIPAPGMGMLACARGGPESPLAHALDRLGLTADDIAVVSKHDTSTELNDPNEADLHQRVQDALGRTPGNPLLVVSQKTVTGHSKGGAAAWQVDGAVQMMETGVVPGNRTLESLDPLLAPFRHLVHGDRPIRLAPGEQIRACLVTSLGFGHVSAVVALAHPDVFLAAVPAARRDDYLRTAAARRARGAQRRLAARLGRPGPVRRTDRRFGPSGAAEREAEAAMLVDPSARLGPDGSYRTTRR